MKTFNDFVKDVERDLVISLTISTRRKKMTFDDSKLIAKDFVQAQPFTGYEDMFKKLFVLSNKHRVIRKVYIKYSPMYFTAKRNFILKKMRNAIEDHEIENAIKIAKNY